MCHTLLSVIHTQAQDKDKLHNVLVCGKCEKFTEDDAFNWVGTCSIKNVCVSRYQLCTLPR